MSQKIDANYPYMSDDEMLDLPFAPPANPCHAWTENGALAVSLMGMTTVERGDTTGLPLTTADIAERINNDEEMWGQFVGEFSCAVASFSSSFILSSHLAFLFFSKKSHQHLRSTWCECNSATAIHQVDFT